MLQNVLQDLTWPRSRSSFVWVPSSLTQTNIFLNERVESSPHCRKLEIERKYFQTQTNYLHRTAVILAGEAGGFSVSVWSPADCALQTVVSRYIFNYQVLASHTTLFSDHIFFPSLFSLLNLVISKHRQLKEF